LNHTSGEVAIISSRLRGRAGDVEAVLGLSATRRLSGRATIMATATAEGDPRQEAARAFAVAKGVELFRFAPAPLRVAEFERAGRPLGYRLIGPPPAPSAPLDARLLAEALDRLLAAAAPGEVLAEAGVDLADPALVWLDPYDRRRIPADRALEIAGDLVRHRARTARRSFAVGVTRWKRPIVRAFLGGPGGAPVFARDPAEAAGRARRAAGRVAAWASRPTDRIERAAREAEVPFGRIEDGFLRSVGLGAAFVGPLSLVLDESGVYYDPSRPSDLETLLLTAETPAPLLERAAALRTRLVGESVTKYNVGATTPRIVPPGRVGVLVPGQVEDDASILKGAGATRTNLGLLRAARARRPDAFIVYKPHPDVVAGYRRGAVASADLHGLADAVVTDGSIAALYPQCRAVETMTSLSGFEALLRGLEVTTHGQPFYAGWGLTEDLAPHPRRGRPRSLDELVAAALILYPLYVDPRSGLPCGPETALDRLLEARGRAATPSGRLAARLRRLYALSRHRLLGPLARRTM
jgi:capsular polysaccharide export protein